MAISIPHFLRTVDEIEQNSWWAETVGPKLIAPTLKYSILDGVESITEVPKEPLESLLLRIRRLTMKGGAEHLISVQKSLKQAATTDYDRHLLDVWQKYWRLTYIKEPFHMEQNGKREVITRFKIYECLINGHYFHTNNPTYNLILYGSGTPQRMACTHLFFQAAFHWMVLELGFAAVGLHRFINNGNTFEGLPLNNGIATAFDFCFWRNKVDQLDEQYRIFNDWIEQNGGCSEGRWS